MSVQSMSYVIDNSEQKGADLLCLLMIANHAHADGTNSFCGIKTLARECRMSPRQISRIIRKLEKTGEILVERRQGGTHLLTVKMTRDNLSPLTQQCHTPPDIAMSPTPDIAMSPKPLLTINKPSLPAKPAGNTPSPAIIIAKEALAKVEERISFETLDRETKGAPPKGATVALARELAEVCNQNLRLNRGKFMQAARKILAEFPRTNPQEVATHYGLNSWWYEHHWRGQRGQAPSLSAINETWGQWATGKKKDVIIADDGGFYV